MTQLYWLLSNDSTVIYLFQPINKTTEKSSLKSKSDNIIML